MNFLSILTPPASSGSLTFSLQSYDATTNVSLTLTATGLLTTDTEAGVAVKVKDQLATQFIQYDVDYTGQPSFGTDPPVASWRAGRTGHVMSLFSECQYRFEITADTTGGTNYLSTIPVLITLAKARSMGAFLEQPFTDSSGTAYSNSQLADFLALGSSEFVSVTNNYIVETTFVHTEWGFYTRGIQLKKYPIAAMDGPRIRRPNILTTIVIDNTTDLSSKYTLDNDTGWVMFRFVQDLLMNYEPFDMNNEIKVSYIGGYKEIPLDVLKAIVKLTSVIKSDADIKSLRAGSFAVEFRPDIVVFGDIFISLKKYFRSEYY